MPSVHIVRALVLAHVAGLLWQELTAVRTHKLGERGPATLPGVQGPGASVGKGCWPGRRAPDRGSFPVARF